MKQLLTLLFTCILGSTLISQAAAARLVPSPPWGQPHEAYKRIYFDPSGIGYAASDYVLLRTRDNGATWTRLLDTYESNRSDLRRIFFLNSSTFWIYGNGGFYRTVDGGDTLEPITIHVGNISNSKREDSVRSGFFFIDSIHGWALGNGQLLLTDDGGKSWRQRRLPKLLTGPGEPFALWFFDTRTGLAFGGTHIARTEDAAKTWTAVPDSPNIDSLSCAGRDFCIGYRDELPLKVYVSSDAGETWRATDTGLIQGKDTISAFQAIGANDAVLVGRNFPEKPFFLENVDPRTPLPVVPTQPPPRGLLLRWNGTTWQRHEYPEIGHFWAIDYVTATNVWASADTNGILHSTDGGLTWTYVPDYYRSTSPATPTWFVPGWPLPTPAQ